MNHARASRDCPVERGTIRQLTANDRGEGFESTRVAPRPHEYPDGGSFGDQSFHEMAPDESRPAGDEDRHLDPLPVRDCRT